MKNTDNIVNLFIEMAEKYPTNQAIIDKEQRITYAELYADVEYSINYYRERGIKPGDKVLVFVPVSIDLYRIVLALFGLGAIVVFVDEWANKDRVLQVIDQVCIDVLIANPKVLLIGMLYKRVRCIPIRLTTKIKRRKRDSISSVDSESAALITLTTGSTGMPKAALRTHKFLQIQSRVICDILKLSPNAVTMVQLPVVLLANLTQGTTSIIPQFDSRKPQNNHPDILVRQLKKHKVSAIIGSPYFIDVIASQQESLPQIDKIFTGGAPVFPDMASKWINFYANADITVAYGSTEAEPISVITATDVLEYNENVKNGLPVGIIHPDLSLYIIRWNANLPHKMTKDQFDTLTLADGEIGEIVVAGDHVLDAYYNSQAQFERNKIYVAGKLWHRTGDSGCIIDHRLYLHGRCSQLISGESGYLSPFIYEYLLRTIPGVQEGTVLAFAQRVVIVLCLEHSDVDLNTVEHSIRRYSLYYDDIKVVDRLPKDKRHYSKINYRELYEMLTSDLK